MQSGGWGGIRTLGADQGTHAFQASAFDHSATHPKIYPDQPLNGRRVERKDIIKKFIKN